MLCASLPTSLRCAACAQQKISEARERPDRLVSSKRRTAMRLLQDIRVLDLGGFITGPYTAALLADFGADVVKVERPDGGDPFRALRDDLYSPQFQAHNQNKRSLTLDFTRPEGLEALHLMVRTADAFIINNRPRVADKLGIGHDVLCSINPRLIYCSITGFGSDGPYADRPAFDHVGQTLSGWMSRHHQGDESRVAGPAIADRITSYYAAIGILAALHDRDRSGKGRLIEVNMLEANIALCIEPLVQYFDSGQPVPLYLRGAFSQAYTLTCKDGMRIGLHMSSPDKFWHALCRAIDRNEWIANYPEHVDRVRNYEPLAAELARIFRMRDRHEWAERLEGAGVPFAPERALEDLENDPQVRHLQVFYELEHPEHGKIKAAHRPVRVDSDRTIDFRPPPSLGEHSDEILSEAGVSADRIARLRASGII
jgi:crotonobetainyl-CoA:carnitine CoA-transferase CaiB-like acyl-CoA transferase